MALRHDVPFLGAPIRQLQRPPRVQLLDVSISQVVCSILWELEDCLANSKAERALEMCSSAPRRLVTAALIRGYTTRTHKGFTVPRIAVTYRVSSKKK